MLQPCNFSVFPMQQIEVGLVVLTDVLHRGGDVLFAGAELLELVLMLLELLLEGTYELSLRDHR